MKRWLSHKELYLYEVFYNSNSILNPLQVAGELVSSGMVLCSRNLQTSARLTLAPPSLRKRVPVPMDERRTKRWGLKMGVCF